MNGFFSLRLIDEAGEGPVPIIVTTDKAAQDRGMPLSIVFHLRGEPEIGQRLAYEGCWLELMERVEVDHEAGLTPSLCFDWRARLVIPEPLAWHARA